MSFELELTSDLQIEDPRGHSRDTLRHLREALISRAPAVPDSRRPNFFEVQADEHVFYIHISPLSRKITLLATWSPEPVEAIQSA
ncbi:MAG TPA: hypothetical protein VFB23_15755 [Candidatus Acidoferrales bacterium]|jgi:hypothetical protein|nr:hypothetical protein [Candidatus Acidoferrales bacterium]